MGAIELQVELCDDAAANVVAIAGNYMPASQSWESKCAALEAAFRKLAIRRDEAAQGRAGGLEKD